MSFLDRFKDYDLIDLRDVAERAVTAFVIAGAASLVEVSSNYKAAAIAGLAAVLSLLKNAVAKPAVKVAKRRTR